MNRYLYICFLATVVSLPGIFEADAAPVPKDVRNSLDALVEIYVDSSGGKLLAEGSGFFTDKAGTLVTDGRLVSAWLGDGGNTMVVRTRDNDIFTSPTLVSFDEASGIAILGVDLRGLESIALSDAGIIEVGSEFFIRSGSEFIKTVVNRNEEGVLGLQAPGNAFRTGTPLLDASGNAVGVVLVMDSRTVLVPASIIVATIQEPGPTPDSPADVTVEAKIETTTSTKARARVKLRKDDPVALLELAEALRKEGDYSAASDAFKRALQKKPGYAEAYNGLGATYTLTGKYDEAIISYKKAINHNPDYAEAYNGMGAALARQGKYEEAVKAITRAVAVKPSYAEAHANLGFIYDFMGKEEEAESSFRKAIRHRPDFAEAHNGLGVSLARSGRHEEAIVSFQRALETRPEFSKARYNLGLSYLYFGDIESVLSHHSVLTDTDPEKAEQLMQMIESQTEVEPDEAETSEPHDGEDIDEMEEIREDYPMMRN